ncbi:Mitochondrial tRNAs modification protein [Clarireedia jacksonii]
MCMLMKSIWPVSRRGSSIKWPLSRQFPRGLLTLAIETSCDDTSVAILEKHENQSATLHFNAKITSDSRAYGGVHPIVAHESHQENLAGLVNKALESLPLQPATAGFRNTLLVSSIDGISQRKKPDFVTVTRGPGMRANLITGVDTAKGLAVAWQVPILGVNHMQAHALTPRMVSALHAMKNNPHERHENDPPYPFLSLLVSGGNTMLVHSRDLCDHKILANTTDIALGDMIDKAARDILPEPVIKAAANVAYGGLLESFAFPVPSPCYEYRPSVRSLAPLSEPTNYGWSINPPFLNPGPGGVKRFDSAFSFSGIGSKAKDIIKHRPTLDMMERRHLARDTMRVAFEHLASRVIIALESSALENVKTLVVSGGVASNQYLKHILRSILDSRGYRDMRLLSPPPKFCTDNAAMIAWSGIEMWEAGWTSELEFIATKQWSIDPDAADGGILGIPGWKRVEKSS